MWVLSVKGFLFSESYYYAFRASVELVYLFRAVAGSSQSALAGIRCLPIFVHPVDSFGALILRDRFMSVFDS